MFRSNPSRNQAEAGHPLRSPYGAICRVAARFLPGRVTVLGPYGEVSGSYVPPTLTAAPVRAPYVFVPIVEKRVAYGGEVPLKLQPSWPRPLPWRRRV